MRLGLAYLESVGHGLPFFVLNKFACILYYMINNVKLYLNCKDTEVVNIANVGDLKAQGDVSVSFKGKDIFIPFALPGEEIAFEPDGKGRGKITKIITPSPFRTQPICKYYTRCGGCKFQHMETKAYLAFKKEVLAKTLLQRGIGGDINDVIAIPAHTRRRATFNSVTAGSSHWFGFNAPKSGNVVTIDSCPLLTPKLEAFIPALKKQCFGITGDVAVTVAEGGFDVLITAKKYPEFSFLERLGEFAYTNNVARVAWRAAEGDEPEKLAEITQPMIEIGTKSLNLPMAAFLQASKEAQKVLADLVVKEVSADNPLRIADLFCGIGSFTIPLKDTFPDASIVGYDSFAPSVNVLNRIVPAKVQDLFRHPLSHEELDKFDVVVLDPPRAGALEQVKQIALSKPKKVVYVSCNPASFARDACELINSGYKMEKVTPVDQFVFSPHLEIVACFIKN